MIYELKYVIQNEIGGLSDNLLKIKAMVSIAQCIYKLAEPQPQHLQS